MSYMCIESHRHDFTGRVSEVKKNRMSNATCQILQAGEQTKRWTYWFSTGPKQTHKDMMVFCGGFLSINTKEVELDVTYLTIMNSVF